MRELLEAGVHYGHHASRWNPKMAPYIHKKRHSIHVIDLRQTVRGLVRARRFLAQVAEQGGEVILVGTKRQARDVVVEEAQRAGIHYVSERWLGGALTNFAVVTGRTNRLAQLEQMDADGTIESRGKKYAAVLRRELSKLHRNLDGIRTLTRVPDALILIDPRREKNALREAWTLSIPVICLQDTDSDPDDIDIVIPGNDDAMRSIRLVCSKLMDAILAGKARAPQPADAEEQAPAPTPEAPAAEPQAEDSAEPAPAAPPPEPAAEDAADADVAGPPDEQPQTAPGA